MLIYLNKDPLANSNKLYRHATALAMVLALISTRADSTEHKERTLGLQVNQTPKLDYASSFAIARSAGAQEVTMSLAWDELEKSPGQYDSKMLDIAEAFYPAQGTKISLVIPTIDTNNLRLPKDLAAKAFDDPEVIARFNKLTAWVFKKMPHVQLTCLSIGNEIDAYLAADRKKWQQYRNFFATTSAFVRSVKPGLPVGAKTTFDGTVSNCVEDIRQLNTQTDVLMITYYPLQATTFNAREPRAVLADFSKLVASYPQKRIFVLETGYPSSPGLNGSEQKQAEFVTSTFQAWDRFAEHIALIEFLWLNDLTDTELDAFARYYKSSDKPLRTFLGSLGFRTATGTEKPALATFRKEARGRGL